MKKTLDEMSALLREQLGAFTALAEPSRLLAMVGSGFLEAQRGADGVWRFDEAATLGALRNRGMVPHVASPERRRPGATPPPSVRDNDPPAPKRQPGPSSPMAAGRTRLSEVPHVVLGPVTPFR